MKKILYILVLILGFGVAYSCVDDVKDKFDDPAAVRMEKTLAQYRDILTSAPNGWVMRYYPHSRQIYGGYTMLLEFPKDKKDTVYVSSEVADDFADKAVSLFSLKSDMGPTINFDTYNEIFHFFSDPSIPVGGGSGYGLLGDYEFVFQSVTSKEIVLEGKKTKNKIVMFPLSEGINWEEYLDNILDKEDEWMISTKFELQLNDMSRIAYVSTGGRVFNFVAPETTDEDEEKEQLNGAFASTTTGIQFYTPLVLKGSSVSMQNFDWDNDQLAFVCTDPGVNAKLAIAALTPSELLSTSDWYFKTGNFGPSIAPAWNQLKNNVLSIGEELAYAYLGPIMDGTDGAGRPSFTFGCYEPGVRVWWGFHEIKYVEVDNDPNKINISLTGLRFLNGDYYYALFKSFLTVLAGPVVTGGPTNATEGKTYTVATDDDLRPTKLTITDVSDANNWFVLISDEVQFP